MKSLEQIAKQSYLSLDNIVKIEEYILETGYMSAEKVRNRLEWFTLGLGIDEYYFKTTPVLDIARHIISLSASELISQHGGEGVGVQLANEREDRATYIVEELPEKTEEIESRIEKRYPSFRLESYRTKKLPHGYPLRFYIVTRPKFKGEGGGKKSLSFEECAGELFLGRSVQETVERYRKAWEDMNNRESPYILLSNKPETAETRVMVGIHGEVTRQFLRNFTHLLDKYEIQSNRKYTEPFFDRKRIYTFYFDKLSDEIIEEFTRDLNAVVMLPENPITTLFHDEIYTAQQTMYAISAAAFTHQFISGLTTEYTTLQQALRDQPEARGILDNLKMHLIKDTYSSARIAQTVVNQPEIVHLLYTHFVERLHPRKQKVDLGPRKEEILQTIEREVPYNKDRKILKHFLVFNEAVQKTNFFLDDKTCMAYRLQPSFLDRIDFPDKPFGLFFLVGRAFIGFHVRFRDIARGGIRIVRSRNLDAYAHNVDTIFLETYNLASTQQRKNKDIPEGGSKGTILLNPGNQSEAEEAFKSYVDGLLDVMTPTEQVRDLYGEKEILFLGPDEGSAGYMDWAALHARKCKYPFWKAFSTGKSPELGGVPHDLYGMTTRGVHEYVLGILEKLELQEASISKIQTGGPDGDLGSNEILISKDRTIAVVDGSGVLYDPAGISREELKRLARKRVTTDQFNRSVLSPEGFFVSVNDRDVQLPDGSKVPNGEEFRNKFHLHPLAKADLFVPCGGRPGAININNWKELLDENGKPKVRVIVEGANLFITEDARLRLEEKGLIVLKDASANKGGVTSSSLEVFASLAMSDEEFEEHMRVKNGSVPDFRKAYVKQIVQTIKSNARAEFELIWKENCETGMPFTVLSNTVSQRINRITDAVRCSDLPANVKIREKILLEYTPKQLLELVGMDRILKRVPSSYLNAIVSTKIAINFLYSHGLTANEVDFSCYIQKLMK